MQPTKKLSSKELNYKIIQDAKKAYHRALQTESVTTAKQHEKKH
ncbi:hypothetical protein [Haemophilus paracuniculus]|nr:hypothetical protein [Haemophilus paracuniculus]